MLFERLFGRRRHANREIVERLYAQIVAAARQPRFYAEWQVPDTPLGRFEMIGLHQLLVVGRLKDESSLSKALAQELTDTFFADVESSLRDLGIGDMGIPKRMKKLARMFYGRSKSYSLAIDSQDADLLAEAVTRNVRPGAERDVASDALAHYILVVHRALAAQPIDLFASGRVEFPDAAQV